MRAEKVFIETVQADCSFLNAIPTSDFFHPNCESIVEQNNIEQE